MRKDIIIKYWIEKAHEDHDSALDNLSAGRFQKKKKGQVLYA